MEMPADNPLPNAPTVLVVDDHWANRKLIKVVLGSERYRVIEATDGSEGLTTARLEHPDLVITDIVMPAMDGFEFVRQLRIDDSTAQTRVIFYTATYLENEARQLASSCGVSQVILKPAAPEEILTAVRTALEQESALPSPALSVSFERDHLRLMTDKLSDKIDDLEKTNLLLTQEVAQRRRAELALQKSHGRLERLSSIRQVSSDINSATMRTGNRHELLQETARLAVKHGQFTKVVVNSVDAADGQLTAVACAEAEPGWDRDDYAPGSVQSCPIPEITRAALAGGEPIICNDIESEKRFDPWRHEALARGQRAAAALPLMTAQNALGVIEFYAARPGFFSEEETALLRDLAADLCFALQYIDNQDKIAYLAYYDALTGLANRALFCDRVNQFAHASPGDKIRTGIIVLELERFNDINETFGRHAGDALLKDLAKRLTAWIGSSDRLAAVGRNRFAAYLPAIKDAGTIGHFFEDVMRAIAEAPFVVAGETMRLTVKGGASIYPADGEDAAKLLENAETALQRAKSCAENYLLFTAQMNARIAQTLMLENQLRHAIDHDEFVLHYQPIIDARSQRVMRLEGLLRWNHPEKGLVSPAAFIPVLEESGLIVDAGNWVLRRAAADYLGWADLPRRLPRISINVSALQLKNKNFVARVVETAQQLPAGALELEITESTLLDNPEEKVTELEKIRDLGVGIVIDDFGTGYSSLSYLAKLPISTLKIDRSFIRDIESNQRNLSIVTGIISLAHSLELRVVAEGVETEPQLQILQSLNCDEIQGFLFSPAVSPVAVIKFLED
jgi:diguanylate cyclase (GGDEF)-like protein